MKRSLDEIAAEVECLGSIISIIADELMPDEVHSTPKTIGIALNGLEMYCERISENLSELEVRRNKHEVGI